jgi:hypothetical protein
MVPQEPGKYVQNLALTAEALPLPMTLLLALLLKLSTSLPQSSLPP